MTQYVIEDGVPLPPEGPKRKYPILEMKAGQSFLIPVRDQEDGDRILRSIHGIYRLRRKKDPALKITMRVFEDNGQWYIRCWRVQ